MPTVQGLILAGSANPKDDLRKHRAFDKRLTGLVLRSLDIAYGQRGFAEAIESCLEVIGNEVLLGEKRILTRFFDEVARGNGMCCFSARDTMGALKTLILCVATTVFRCQYIDGSVALLDPKSKPPGAEVARQDSLVDWICENYLNFGSELLLRNAAHEGIWWFRWLSSLADRPR